MDNQMYLDKIHYKYNFIILKNDIDKQKDFQGEGKRILLSYPLDLDFNTDECNNPINLSEDNNVTLRIKEENNKNGVKIGLNGSVIFSKIILMKLLTLVLLFLIIMKVFMMLIVNFSSQ